MMNDNPLVSICMITYNHKDFLEGAIDSILSQKINFPIEIVIGDDRSTDNTPEILKRYATKHPEIFKLNLREKNVGIAHNFAETILACKGKYVAVLEGDDYWIDDHKLQKQFDYMNDNGNIPLCYTHCMERYEVDGSEIVVSTEHPDWIDLSYLLTKGWFMRTPTLFFRRDEITQFPDWYYTSYSTDYILHILLAEKGKVGKLEDATAVYRKHEQGISVVDSQKQIRRFEDKFDLLDTINKHFKGKYKQEINQQEEVVYWNMLSLCVRSKIYSNKLLSRMKPGIFVLFLRKIFARIKS